jgi:hypothetical protein
MASTLIGTTATVYALDGCTVAFSGMASTDNEMTGGLTLNDSFDKAEIMGKDGRVPARGASNRRHTLTVEVVFMDPGGAATRATAAGKTALPGKFSIVTLAGFNNALFNGDWNYEGGSISTGVNGFMKASLSISRTEKADGTMAAMPVIPAS